MINLRAPRRRTIFVTMLILTLIWLLFFGNQVFQAARQLLETQPAGEASEQPWLLQALEQYGLPLLFGGVTVAAAGIPLPVSLLLLAVGAAAGQGQYSVALVIGVALVAAVLGDHLGYLLGWSGGRWLVQRLARLLKSEEQLPRAQATVRERGWMAIFLSRWLLLPLGSPCNWICGSLRYPMGRFFVADVLGETLYVCLTVFLGVTFSAQIEGVATLIGRLGLWFVGLSLAAFLGWKVLRRSSSTLPETRPNSLEGGSPLV
ncbi:MAG: VTT domain-containing protein [Chloroflexota bacterium]|nr:VTT domain-containing protein [Chloroflexota bacterium]PLS79291.1 MAG: DedA family protein [Chloroflexota bacterium]